MIPLSVEFLLTTSAAETNSSPPGRNTMSCTWPKRAEYVDVICEGKLYEICFFLILKCYEFGSQSETFLKNCSYLAFSFHQLLLLPHHNQLGPTHKNLERVIYS